MSTSRFRHIVAGALTIAVVSVLSGCLSRPGDTASVVKVDLADVDGWHDDYYENRAYPCSISGYQTFAIGRRIGSSNTAERPLWVKLRGGGKGYFDAQGEPQPSAENKTQISLPAMLAYDTPGLMARVKDAPEGFRTLLVSMCSHDLYADNDNDDPNNPNLAPDGSPRLTNGLIAAKAALQFTRSAFPTTSHFLHGTSAGGAGQYHVAWALQLQGLAPAGIVSDSGIISQDRESALPLACGRGDAAGRARLAARVSPPVADPANEPDRLVSRGALTVPIVQVWNHGDPNTCGATPMSCVVRDGSTVTLGATDCVQEDMRRAIAAQGAGSRSESFPVCVAGPVGRPPCGLHVVTTREGCRQHRSGHAARLPGGDLLLGAAPPGRCSRRVTPFPADRCSRPAGSGHRPGQPGVPGSSSTPAEFKKPDTSR